MLLSRLALVLAVTAVLAACDNSPKPAATTTPAAEQPAPQTVAAPAPAEPAAPATPASGEAMAPMIGTWAADLGACGTAGATITIAAGKFDGAENPCDITALNDNSDGSFTASLSCTGEGQATTESVKMIPVFAPTGEGINLTYLDRGGEEVTVLRCRAPAAAAGQ